MRIAGRDNCYVVDYYVGHKFRGKGAGYNLLEGMVKHIKEVAGGDNVLINIKKDNIPSRKTVEKLIRENGFGYQYKEERDMHCYKIRIR